MSALGPTSILEKRKGVIGSMVFEGGGNDSKDSSISVSRNCDDIDELLKDQIDKRIGDDDFEADKPTPRTLPSSVERPEVKSHLRDQNSTLEQEDVDERKHKKPRSSGPSALTTPRMKKSKSSETVKQTPSTSRGTFQRSKSAGRIRTLKELEDVEFVDREKYVPESKIGSGSYGKVFKALQKSNGKHVAIKLVDGVFSKVEDSKRIYREIFLLKRLKNPFIIKLVDLILPTGSTSSLESFDKLALVFDFVDTDLFKLVRSNQFLKISHVQFIMFQLLSALNYLHFNKIVHRDLKPANVLIYSDVKIKICDFGLARIIDSSTAGVLEDAKIVEAELLDEPKDSDTSSTTSQEKETSAEKTESELSKSLQRKLTKHVVTRWYRAPELILLLKYDTMIDIWSAGCILGELLQMINVPFMKRTPMFPGKSCFPLTCEHEQVYKNKTDQLNEIFKVIGTPGMEDIEHLEGVKGYLMSLEKKNPINLHTVFPSILPAAVDLLKMMLTFNPRKRVTAEQSLMTEFFQVKTNLKVTVEKCAEDLSACEEESRRCKTIDGYKKLILEDAKVSI